MNNVLDHALAYLAANYSVIPIALNGSKLPEFSLLPLRWNEEKKKDERTWNKFREERVCEEEAWRWWQKPGPPGIALVAGEMSLGLELIDFDQEADVIFPAWREMVEAEWPGLLSRVSVVKSPAGYHVWLRCPDVEAGNDKLARRSAEEKVALEAEAAREGRKGFKAKMTLIETRGEGGYALAPGCPPECHPSGKTYEHHSGRPLLELDSISMDERDFLITCARSFDRQAPAPEPTPKSSPGNDMRPGDDFDRRGWDWADILERYGWKLAFGSPGGERRWRRPGKDHGWSATTGHCSSGGAELLRVFSSNADPFQEERAYGKFRALAMLECNGDLAKCASMLRGHGFGGTYSGRAPANGQHTDPGHNGHAGNPPVAPTWSFSPIDSRQLDEETESPEWLIKRLLVKGQPGVVGGPQKSGKTTISIDLAVSLATGTPFLGTFDVYKRRRTAVISGESGRWTIMNVARQVCRSKGVRLPSVDVLWQFDLPKLADPLHLSGLRAGLRERRVEVLVVDPLYLCLLNGAAEVSASNLYQTGPLLLGIASACLEAGATPVLLHHTNRPANAKREPLELGDLAFSGIAEFARQWVLLNRRERFVPGEPSKLWMSAGGSSGQCGLWAVDVDEGQLDDDFQGRKWEVTVTTGGDEFERLKAARRAQKRGDAEERSEKQTAFMVAFDLLAEKATTVTVNAVRKQMKLASGKDMSGSTFNALVAELEREEVIETYDARGCRGKGAEGDAKCVRRVIDDHVD